MASKIYEFSVGEPQSSQYQLTVDGKKVPLYLARVSAAPINRRWPGHQRPIDQTELASFALFQTDGETEITVIPRKNFSSVTIHPLSKKITPDVKNGMISFVLPRPGTYTVELDGYHEALHLFADSPNDYSPVPDNSILYFGKGIHEPGLIELKTGQTLFIDEGAVVYGRVHAIDADNIRIIGHGILDASRNHEKILFEMGEQEQKDFQRGFAVNNAIRTHTIDLEYCDNVLISGITVRDSLVYTVHPVCCRNITINSVKIIGNWRYNSDGIDLHNCENVIIRNCFVRTYDDSICLKGFDYLLDEKDMFHNGHLYDTFDHVLVENCVIWCDWGRSLEFGAETRVKEIKNVVFRSCDLIRNSICACDIQNVDYAEIHNVLFEDINVDYDAVSQPIVFQKDDSDFYHENPESTYMPLLLGIVIKGSAEYSKPGCERGKIHDIIFRNIQVHANKMPPSVFSGADSEHKVSRVTVDGLFFNGQRVDSMEESRISCQDYTEDIDFRVR